MESTTRDVAGAGTAATSAGFKTIVTLRALALSRTIVFTVQALTRVNLAWDADRQRGQSAITSAPEQPAQESKYRHAAA
jgi:hypothetical protein